MENPISEILQAKGRALFAVAPRDSVYDAVRLMNEKNIGAVAVLDGGRLVGMFTERDVLRRVIDSGCDARTTPIADVMTREIVYVRPDTTVQEAMIIVRAKACRHLPVMEGDTAVGMVSVRDLITHVVDGQEHRIAELVQYISGNYGPEIQTGS